MTCRCTRRHDGATKKVPEGPSWFTLVGPTTALRVSRWTWCIRKQHQKRASHLQRAARSPRWHVRRRRFCLDVRTVAGADRFARDIQPLLRANCYGCHGDGLQSGNFRLDRRRDSLPNRVGANGARIVPGNSAASRALSPRVGQAREGCRCRQPARCARRDQHDQGVDRSGRRLARRARGRTAVAGSDPAATQLLDGGSTRRSPDRRTAAEADPRRGTCGRIRPGSRR